MKKVKCVNCKKNFKVPFFWWCIQKLKDRKSGFICDTCNDKWLKEREELLNNYP